MDTQPVSCSLRSEESAPAETSSLSVGSDIGRHDDLLVGLGEFAQRLTRLSQTELTVLSLMARGLLNKQIAHHCGTAQSTIKSHVTQVLRKLRARSRTAAAVRYAVYVERLRCASQRGRTAA